MDIVKKHENFYCGIGGWRCYCCGPKDKKEKRLIRKRVRKLLKIVSIDI